MRDKEKNPNESLMRTRLNLSTNLFKVTLSPADSLYNTLSQSADGCYVSRADEQTKLSPMLLVFCL